SEGAGARGLENQRRGSVGDQRSLRDRADDRDEGAGHQPRQDQRQWRRLRARPSDRRLGRARAGDAACGDGSAKRQARRRLAVHRRRRRHRPLRGAGGNLERVLVHFEKEAGFCGAYGSPFTSELARAAAEDIKAGGPTAALVADWPPNPRADVVALRLAGALHAAVLTGRDPALAALYPGHAARWRMAEVWRAARACLARECDWVRAFMRSPP